MKPRCWNKHLVLVSRALLQPLQGRDQRLRCGRRTVRAEEQHVDHRRRQLAQLVAHRMDERGRIGWRPGRRREAAQPSHLHVEVQGPAEGHAEVRCALAHSIRFVFEDEAALVEQTPRDRQLERQVALALVVAQPAGLLADLVAIDLGERPKARRREQPRADLGGKRGTIGAEEVDDQPVDRDGRTERMSLCPHLAICIKPRTARGPFRGRAPGRRRG